IHDENTPRPAPDREHIFSGEFPRNRQKRREFHAIAVAEKTRHRPKKSATGMRRKAAKTPSLASTRVSAAKPAHRRKPEAEGAAALGMNAKKTTQRQGFKTHEFIVYPAHGVGQIVAIEEQEVA